MANKEVVTVLTVKTEQSQNTIKGLKQEIADLKKKLDSAVIGTDEFERASKELATAQANLKTVLADGKKTTDAVEGSYNHLVATMVELKKQWKATADEVKRNELGQQIDSINSKLKEMDASTGNFQRNVGDYANQFKEAFEEQQKSTQNVRLGLDGLQKTAAGLASGYAAVQGVMNLLNIENSNFEKAMIKVQSAMAIAQGVGGMKDLIEGAGTLKVMFNSCITSVNGFITKLSGVKKAIAATGIGLLVVALGTLITYWDEVTEFIGISNKAAEDAAKKQKAAAAEVTKNAENWRNKVSNAADTIISKYSLLVAQYKKLETESQKQQWIKDNADAFNDLGLSITNVQDAENSFINNTGKVVDALIKRATAMAKQEQLTELAGKYMDARLRAEETYQKNKVNAGDKVNGVSHTVEGGYEEVARYGSNSGNWVYTVKGAAKKNQEIWNSAIQEAKNIFVEMNNLAESLAGDLKDDIITPDFRKTTTDTSTSVDAAKEKAKAIADAARKITIDTKEEELAELKRIYDEEKLLLEQYGIDTVNLTEIYKQKVSEIEQKYNSERDTAWKTIQDARKSDKELEIEKLEVEKEKYIELFKDEKEKLLAIEEWYRIRLQEIDEKYTPSNTSSIGGSTIETNTSSISGSTIEKTPEQFIDEYGIVFQKIRKTAGNTAAYVGIAFTQALSSASQIIGAIQAGIDTSTEEGFEKNKKMQKAQAWINIAQGILAAVSTAMIIPPPMGPIIGAMNAGTVATVGAIQIANINKQKFNGGSPISTETFTPSINLGETMPIQYTRELLTDSETTNLNKEQKVYVLESDISNTQENVKVKESNSSF